MATALSRAVDRLAAAMDVSDEEDEYPEALRLTAGAAEEGGPAAEAEAVASAFDPARFGTLVTADKVETVSSLTPGPRGLIVLDYEGALAQEIFLAIKRNDTNAFTQATLRLFHWRSFPAKYNAAGGNYQVTGTKGVARIAGLALGGSRPPLPSITEEDLAALKNDLTIAGMLPQPLEPYWSRSR